MKNDNRSFDNKIELNNLDKEEAADNFTKDWFICEIWISLCEYERLGFV